MRYRSPRPCLPRRGVTLVEMLVAIALLVLMMSTIVTIFTSATGALSGMQTYQQLDGDLRQLDMTIRQDLTGVTARMTPPLNPRDGLGYFEYGENSFADIQNEDTDDYLRFTAKAPDGQPFMGRMWLNAATNDPAAMVPAQPAQPVIVTSQFAEIIYFLRNGNLYRRVLLIAPDRQASVNTVIAGMINLGVGLDSFKPSSFYPSSVSWQGVNDLSAHPAPSGSIAAQTQPIVLNSLSHLTNRENRAFYPRFANDYVTHQGGASSLPDGIPDDEDIDSNNAFIGDGVPDLYPTLYGQVGMATPYALLGTPRQTLAVASPQTMAFPYLFPGMYSRPDTFNGATTGAGWIHSTNPIAGTASTPALALAQLNSINHSPLERGELPLAPPTVPQTYWGFPTWKETLLPQWNDPYWRVSTGVVTSTGIQPRALNPFWANAVPSFTGYADALPPMTADFRVTPQPFNDGTGSNLLLPVGATTASTALWRAAWEDDLIMTGVRSFDIKAYDDSFPGYVDLGWGDDLRLQPATAPAGSVNYLAQASGLQFVMGTPSTFSWTNGSFYTLAQSFAHEGRIPPRFDDLRYDPQYPPPAWNFNVGDDQEGVQRLRRVWDTWSTDYTQAPATGFHPTTKLPIGPPWGRPVYPSYPPPYPMALRGIQIQIRVVDPKNEKVKTLTIRQDFSDKL